MAFSPYFLMLGHKPKIPVDFKMGFSSPKTIKRSHYQFINTLQDKLAWAYDWAMKAQDKEVKRHKEGYDQQACSVKLGSGDLVIWLQCQLMEDQLAKSEVK